MAPNWKADEITLACRAYAIATNNGIKGSDQDVDTFSNDICEKLKLISKENAKKDFYYKRKIEVC